MAFFQVEEFKLMKGFSLTKRFASVIPCIIVGHEKCVDKGYGFVLALKDE